jgi:ubiquinone/menaquinone biosynthesis C-methylase UbiE
MFVAQLAADDVPESINTHISKSQGVVLDVGPGSGTQLFRFKSSADKISAIYFVEPNEAMHASLAKKAEEMGLGGKFHILTCGGEPESLIPALQKAKLLGSTETGASGTPVFDEVTCILVLCGVPEPQATINGLYKLLKPGGRFVFCEHVVAESGWARFLQRWYHLVGWQTLIGGCNMDRDTGKWIQDAAEADGGWEKVDFEPSDRNVPLGYVVGSLIKKRESKL